MNTTGEIKLHFRYHRTQAQVFTSGKRFKVVACGRRWGKTRGGIQWLTKKGVTKALKKGQSLCWWVAPTYRHCKTAYRYFKLLYGKTGIIESENKAELTIDLVGGCRLEFRSAEVPDNLRGEGVDYMVLDECSTFPDSEIWHEILRPMLMDTKGEAILIGTPKGQNWFWEEWTKGQGGHADYKSWSFSTYDNPFLDPQEVKQTESELPELVAKQELHAEFLELGGMVFRNVDVCCLSVVEPPVAGEHYQLGVDLGKYQDFTVIIVRKGKRMVYFERFNKIDWSLQKQRIIDVALRYNKARVVMDSTGVGDPIYEDLSRSGINIEPFMFTNATKSDLINNLVVKFDKRDIEITTEPILKQELKLYSYEITSRGRLRMNAPSGKHDDCVISLALAYWGAVYKPSEHSITSRNGRIVIKRTL